MLLTKSRLNSTESKDLEAIKSSDILEKDYIFINYGVKRYNKLKEDIR